MDSKSVKSTIKYIVFFDSGKTKPSLTNLDLLKGRMYNTIENKSLLFSCISVACDAIIRNAEVPKHFSADEPNRNYK